LANLGEVRSIIPKMVNITVLTATATRSLRRSATGTIGMDDAIVVTVSPDKPNIIFATARYRSLEEIADPSMNLLKKERTCMG